ncbi:MAG TPA: 1-(5-phosphoribosyl)-5-[(5-phosphoribosylamino)methylideneamino] imidazole-4-carboxamide isomerase [Cytophagales bacterium]|nr:1-(5-phosphoribosyl)-5-[(5-phosphoribosylamino)methylideneamino] imidazole-4-carboxamide isomerase [Cytophagales bacterium]
MIEVIPSIQIIGGKCIRLRQGDYSSEKVYDENPLNVAKIFEDSGLKKVHLIDLDGARAGRMVNYPVLQLIAGHTDLIIDFSGGIRTDGDIGKAYEFGANTVTVGSIAVKDQELLTSWIFSYGREKIILGADVENEKIAVSGWQKGTQIDLFEHIEYFIDRSIKYVKCSDILRDGVLQGPNFSLYERIMKRLPEIKLYASGGISSVDDIKRLQDIGVHGVIFGRSYYEGKIKLEDLAKFGQ